MRLKVKCPVLNFSFFQTCIIKIASSVLIIFLLNIQYVQKKWNPLFYLMSSKQPAGDVNKTQKNININLKL